MRGFASRIIPKKKGDTVLVWMYRKNATPCEPSTVDVGVEDKFYQHGELDVDPEITEREGRFATCVNELRRKPDGFLVTDSTLLEFVVHLTSRTKHLRDSFINGGGLLADGLLTYLSSNWREYFRRYFAKNRKEVKDRLEQSLQEKNASAFHRAKTRQLVNSLTPKAMVQLIEQTGNYDVWFPMVRQYMAAELNNVVKQAHIKSLSERLVSEPRMEHFQKFQWFVRRSTEPLILGDVCCLFEIDSKFKSLGGVQENIQRIHVPISSDCVIVANVTDEVPSINPVQLNEASAKVSRNYFVAHESSSENVRLQALLGTESEPLTTAEMAQILKEVIEETS
jgi:hypothetical protein